MTAFSLGIGLTNECNNRCAHCYRPDTAIERVHHHRLGVLSHGARAPVYFVPARP